MSRGCISGSAGGQGGYIAAADGDTYGIEQRTEYRKNDLLIWACRNVRDGLDALDG